MILFWIEDDIVKESYTFVEDQWGDIIEDIAGKLEMEDIDQLDHELRQLHCHVNEAKGVTLLLANPTPESTASNPNTTGANDARVVMGADGKMDLVGSPGPGVQVLEGDGVDALVDMIEGMTGEDNNED